MNAYRKLSGKICSQLPSQTRGGPHQRSKYQVPMHSCNNKGYMFSIVVCVGGELEDDSDQDQRHYSFSTNSLKIPIKEIPSSYPRHTHLIMNTKGLNMPNINKAFVKQ